MVKLEGEYVFDGPRIRVWEILRDPEMLARALPGTKSLEKISDTEFEGKMHLRIGAVSGDFAGRVFISNEVPPKSCTLSVDGRGAAGFARGEGRVYLEERDNTSTLMRYEGEMQVGGRLAGVGQRLMESVSKSIIRQGLDALNVTLQPGSVKAIEEPKSSQPVAGSSQAIEPQATTPPSETQFAAAIVKDVVKDMAGDWITPENTAILVTGFVAILAMLVGFLLGRMGKRDSYT